MENSSEEHSGSVDDIPQQPRVADKAKVTERKSTKLPKAPKKKVKSESTEEDDDIPSAHSQPEDELVTNSKTLISDGNPNKGGRGRERNTAAEMSDLETYKTPPGVETTQERNNRLQKICRHWAKKWFNYGNVTKRENAKAKREARAAKKNQVEQGNVELTQQDVQEKKERASARKEKKKRKSVSPRTSEKKSVARKSWKVASASSDDSSNDNAGKEIPMYDQRALLDKPYQTPSLAKISPPLRSSPRLAPIPSDKPSGSAAPVVNRKLMTDEKAIGPAKKAKKIVPTSTEEYNFDLMFDIIEGASYDANPSELSSLGLPDDVTKMVTKHFTELKGITKELKQAVEDKKLLEKTRNEARSESERKDVNKGILEITKALTVMRNNKIEWHSKLKMDVSQLCDRRNEEIKRQADLARRREKEEKQEKAQARASQLKASKDRRIQFVTMDAPVDTSAPLQQIPPSPRPEEEFEQHTVPAVVMIPTAAAQESDVVDMYLVNPDEVNVVLEQNAPEERIDEKIEMEKEASLPLKKGKN
nr:DNA ligase 1-like [Aegilops tauschii subsp. strangulata]